MIKILYIISQCFLNEYYILFSVAFYTAGKNNENDKILVILNKLDCHCVHCAGSVRIICICIQNDLYSRLAECSTRQNLSNGGFLYTFVGFIVLRPSPILLLYDWCLYTRYIPYINVQCNIAESVTLTCDIRFLLFSSSQTLRSLNYVVSIHIMRYRPI